MRALGVRIEQPGATHVRVHGVGLRGLRGRGRRARHGQCRHGHAAVHRTFVRRRTFDSRLIGDASLMKRPMERVAKPLREMGADRAHPQRHAARGHQRRAALLQRHRLRHAGGQRPGQIRHPAGRAVCGGRDHGDLARRCAAITASACCRAAACESRPTASRTTVYPPQSAREPALERARRFLLGRVLHRGGLAGRGAGGIAAAKRRAESDAHRPAGYPAQHGRATST